MSSIAPGGDDERHPPEAADKDDPPPVESDAGLQEQEEQRPAAHEGEPVRESEWGFLAAAVELCRGRRARRGKELVMGYGRTRPLAALLAGAVAVLSMLAAGCGGDDEPGGPDRAATSSVSTLANGVLTVGSDIPFAPFEFRDGKQLTGFDVELTEELARRLELRVEWVDTSFDTLFTQVAAGRFDMSAAATTITPERERQVNFTAPYYAAQQALTVNASSPGIRTVDDLSAGDVVAVQKGTTGEAWARENLPDGVKLRSFPEAPDIYTALEAGAVTALIMDEPSAVTETTKRKSLVLAQTIDTEERYGFAVDPRNRDLLDALNRELGAIKQDGTYQRLYDRYDDLPPKGSILAVEG
jgi:polar amino acid transport system substrate-binding protein